MRNVLPLLLLLVAAGSIHAQDFSNKGKEFWIGYGNHASMFAAGFGAQKMSLYITSDVNTSGTVEIPGLSWSLAFTVKANTVTVVDIPQEAALEDEGRYMAGIHVVSQRPIVVYGHIFLQNASGATLCLPVTTLGREYVSINYEQVSNSANSYSYVFVIATEDNTTVEITPTVPTKKGWAANVKQTITLNKGEIYQVLSAVDLTGTTIKSVTGAGGGCKRIAVFSGSGRLYMGCPNANSSDNLYQQIYPASTWGKKYITINSHNAINKDHENYYRIFKSKPGATVILNGSEIPDGNFTDGLYFTFSNKSTNVITSDEPIQVVQYFVSQACTQGASDPEMIFLNPIEQTISNVTLFSSPNFQIYYHGLNVVVKNSGTAISSMKLDGQSIGDQFKPMTQDPSYWYAKLTVGENTHNLVSDSGFNAIAFGFGEFESYGYSAGTNLKDLYQFINVQNDYSTVNFPAACKNTPAKFSIVLPYLASEIRWVFGPALNAMGINDTIVSSPPIDSTWNVNGRTLNRYRLDKRYTINTPNTYPISIFVTNPTATDGCSGEQEIQYDLQVFDRPKVSFQYKHSGCLSDEVTFTDNSAPTGRPIMKWSWEFGDGNTAAVKNPLHKYAAANSYTVKFSSITDVGCLSDTAETTIPISNPPKAIFAEALTRCEKDSVLFTDQSDPVGSNIVEWRWNFGDSPNDIIRTNGNSINHYFAASGEYTVMLIVKTITGCVSVPFSKKIMVHPKPRADFGLPLAVCLPGGIAGFNDQSTISDGTQAQLSHLWKFDDGNTSTDKNPVHNYTGPGPFNVNLFITSDKGCVHDTTKLLSNVFAQPDAAFNAPSEICISDSANLQDLSSASSSTVNQWFWDFDDGTTSAVRHPKKKWSTAGPHVVKLFIKSAVGCTSDIATATIVVNGLPQAAFNFSAPSCETGNINFSDISVPTAGALNKWTWKFGDGGTSGTRNPAHVFAKSGPYSVSLDVETDKGCKSGPISKTIMINPLPVPNFGLPKVCSSDPFAEFTDSTKIADGSEAQFSYLWNFGDQNANGANPNSSIARNARHRFIEPGDYLVHLTVTSKDGCVRDTTRIVTINGSMPQAGFKVSTNTDLCSNKDVTVIDGSSVDIGKLIRVEIFWDYLNDPTRKTVDDDPVPGRSYSFKYPEFGSPLTKNFQIRYVVYSGETCLKTDIQNITLKAAPGIQFNAVAGVCEEIEPFQFTQASETFGFTGSGVFTGTGVSPGGVFDPGAASAGLHTIRYTFTGSNGCMNFQEKAIRVYPTPVVDAGPDRVVLEGGVITIATKVSGNGLTYQWSPAIGLDNTKVSMPKASPVEDQEYTLQVGSVDGCNALDKVFVKVLKQIRVPNAFSPNNDGINDRWEVLYLESYPGCEIDVFNRYGQPVFKSVGYNTPWDGTFKGSPLPVGTYYWIINPKNGRKAINGSVTIIR